MVKSRPGSIKGYGRFVNQYFSYTLNVVGW
jgi:hypothetical protein